MTVQSARLLGFTVYATASAKHHDYIKSLGASRVFDYRDSNVEGAIVQAAKEEGLIFQHGYDAVEVFTVDRCPETNYRFSAMVRSHLSALR